MVNISGSILCFLFHAYKITEEFGFDIFKCVKGALFRFETISWANNNICICADRIRFAIERNTKNLVRKSLSSSISFRDIKFMESNCIMVLRDRIDVYPAITYRY